MSNICGSYFKDLMGVIKHTNESNTKSKYETGQTKLFIYSHWNVHEAEWSSIHKCLTKWLNHNKRNLWWESLILSCLEWVQLETSFHNQMIIVRPTFFPHICFITLWMPLHVVKVYVIQIITLTQMLWKVRGARLYEKAEEVSMWPSALLHKSLWST